MATSLGSTKLTKPEEDLGAEGTVQPFPPCLEGKAPTLGTSLGLHNPTGGIKDQGSDGTQLLCSIWAQHPREKHEDGLGLAALLLNHSAAVAHGDGGAAPQKLAASKTKGYSFRTVSSEGKLKSALEGLKPVLEKVKPMLGGLKPVLGGL